MSDEITPEIMKKTRDSLEKFIKKPPLSDKLLKKPPFRFLHDIITNVIHDTGFLNGLYNETEMQSENIKDRESKIAFLQKLIDTMKIISGTKFSARPSKIIAGLEPIKTNQLLQGIGLALEKNLDSTQAIKQITGVTVEEKNTKNLDKHKSKTEQKRKTDDTKKTKDRSDERALKKKPSPRVDDKKNVDEKRSKEKLSRRQNSKEVESPKDEKIKENKNRESKTKERENKRDKNSKIERKESIEKKSVENIAESPKEKKRSVKTESKNEDLTPKELPSISEEKVVENNKNETNTEETSMEMSALKDKVEERANSEKEEAKPEKNIKTKLEPMKTMTEHKTEPLKVVSPEPMLTKKEISQRPSTSLRPPSVRPSSARPAAPRLKERTDTIIPADQLISMGKVNVIIENTDKQLDDEETVVLETSTEDTPQQESIEENIPAEKGHLVSQILDQIGETPITVAPKAQIQWEQKNLDNGSVKLKQSIQTLTRAANPLGKLINFLHEDVESMQSELKSWIDVNAKLKNEIQMKKRENEESMKPLQEQLHRLESEIAKQQEMISSTQANILKNHNKIKQLLIRE